MAPGQLIDLTGKRFGRWTVIEKMPKEGKNTQIKWLCRCDCGTVKPVLGYVLKAGDSKSCGCWAKEFQRERLLREMRDNPDKYGLKPQTGAASVVIEKDGKSMTLTEWSKETGISLSALIRRWNRGWSPEEMLEPTINQFREKYSNPDPQFNPLEFPNEDWEDE